MIVLRNEQGIMIAELVGESEKDMRSKNLISSNAFSVEYDEDFSHGFIVTEGFSFTHGNLKLFLWAGSRIYMT